MKNESRPKRKALVVAHQLHGARRTDRECHLCGEGTFLKRGHELVCDTCGHAPDPDSTVQRTDSWELFWSSREQYSGFTGPDRIRMIGGFAGAYEYGGEESPY
jgi:uncharacterized Zn finger protein (UPF0148 family)